MPKTKNLLKRADRYYGRVAVPKSLRELRKAAGRPNPAEVVKSLQTPDHRAAQRLLTSFLDRCYRDFEREETQLRSLGAKPLRSATAEDLATIRRQFFRDALRDDEVERTLRKSPAEVEEMLDELRQQLVAKPPKTQLALLCAPGFLEYEVAREAADISAERRRILKDEVRLHLAQSNDGLVVNIIEAYCHSNGLQLEPRSLAHKSLARDLLKEWSKVLDIAEQRDKGAPDPQHIVDALAEEEQASAPAPEARVIDIAAARAKDPRRGKRIRDYFDSYLKECKSHLREKDRLVLRATLRLFVQCNGDKAITEYGRSDMSAFKKGLKEYPANAARIYPGLCFKEVLKRNRSDCHATLNSNTVRSKLTTMSAFGKWLEENADDVDASNFSTSLPTRNDRRRMEPFTLDEVRKILNSNAFIGCESDKNYEKPGKFKLRDWHFWFTLIAAFTGARTNEIMQMEVTDVRDEKGVLIFDISDEGDGKSLKTKGSRRFLPVHPTLVKLGLVDYRDRLAARGAKSLFDGAPIDKDGRRAVRASKWFRKFLGKIGVKGQGDLGGAHRWRHTMADGLRRAGVKDYEIAGVLGHEVDIARMSRHYGLEMDMSLEKRSEVLSKVEYPGVDFSRLMP